MTYFTSKIKYFRNRLWRSQELRTLEFFLFVACFAEVTGFSFAKTFLFSLPLMKLIQIFLGVRREIAEEQKRKAL